MTKILSNMAVSVDGFITGRAPSPGYGLGDGTVLHGWYWDGDTLSTVVPGFRLSAATRRFVDPLAERVGAVVAGRNSYDDANGWGDGSPHPTAPLVVVSHRPAPPEATPAQRFATSIEEALTAARESAGDLDVGLMGAALSPPPWSTRSSSTRCRSCSAPDDGSSRNCPATCGSASSRPYRHPA
ncbi:dihydrofolate reductase family protein [Streptosporangium vulgare]|uniref:Dihydrofolate reductase family protein n=1 Tax=Streptosporangium vulgare TaxID=46190 RepID=A0ABV5TGF5_9ACTN